MFQAEKEAVPKRDSGDLVNVTAISLINGPLTAGTWLDKGPVVSC